MNEPLIMKQTVNKAAVWFVCGLAGLMGLAFMASFFDHLSLLSADDVFMLFLGLAFIGFAVLLARFCLWPYLILDDTALSVRSFFRGRVFRFDQIESMDAYSLWVKPRDYKGRRIHTAQPIETKRLRIQTHEGQVHEVTLPGFGGNARLLSQIAQRSGITIGSLDDQIK